MEVFPSVAMATIVEFLALPRQWDTSGEQGRQAAYVPRYNSCCTDERRQAVSRTDGQTDVLGGIRTHSLCLELALESATVFPAVDNSDIPQQTAVSVEYSWITLTAGVIWNMDPMENGPRVRIPYSIWFRGSWCNLETEPYLRFQWS